eukprot:scaffold3052_cov389-Prasinococcus_capsulatus_cf.AAC.3
MEVLLRGCGVARDNSISVIHVWYKLLPPTFLLATDPCPPGGLVWWVLADSFWRRGCYCTGGRQTGEQ